MAEQGDDTSRGTSDSTNNCNNPGITVPPKSSDDESSESPEYVQDLKSVLVTSVLNLEKLDVDLYR